MPRVERSTNLLTGMIIAALYVILLVGFVRESYTYRNAAHLATERMSWVHWPEIPRDAFRIDLPICRQNQAMTASRQREIWQAMRDDP